MGVMVTKGTMPGGVTPICNDCGVALCWDISKEEYIECEEFWDEWICRDCNNGEPMSLKEFKANKAILTKT